MNFQQAVLSCVARYATFSGRASRSEYWYWQLFLIVAALIASIPDAVLGVRGQPFESIYTLLTLVPTFAVGARRLHDSGRSGWWQLLFAVPLIGWIVLIVWFCTKGSIGYNSYGADPRPHESRDTRHRIKAQEAPSV